MVSRFCFLGCIEINQMNLTNVKLIMNKFHILKIYTTLLLKCLITNYLLC